MDLAVFKDVYPKGGALACLGYALVVLTRSDIRILGKPRFWVIAAPGKLALGLDQRPALAQSGFVSFEE